ncbi:cytochrome C, partial [Vibrio parahaemolyticus]|nr:cytochrome C [Vibrio parahaemolyticus]
QGLSRQRWDETLDWMIEEQGMEDLSGDDREAILEYLSTYYGG